MSRPLTEAEPQPVITGKDASHVRADEAVRQRALDELHGAMTNLLGVVEQDAAFRRGMAEGESGRRQDLRERFEAFSGGTR